MIEDLRPLFALIIKYMMYFNNLQSMVINARIPKTFEMVLKWNLGHSASMFQVFNTAH